MIRSKLGCSLACSRAALAARETGVSISVCFSRQITQGRHGGLHQATGTGCMCHGLAEFWAAHILEVSEWQLAVGEREGVAAEMAPAPARHAGGKFGTAHETPRI